MDDEKSAGLVQEVRDVVPRRETNFLDDLARLCDAWLMAAGFALSATALGPPMGVGVQEINVLYRYFNLHRRCPAAVPRRIHRARDLACPVELAPGLAQVENELTAGTDLTPRLSRRMPKQHQNNDPRKNDHLLADWDIHHLHLGLDADRRPEGQIPGTKLVLFCILDPHDAYLIQVLDHDAFSDPELLEIVHANWPSLLRPLAIDPGDPQTREKVAAARASGILPITGLRGGFVAVPRGGGFTTSGHSFRALRLATDWADVTSQWEECVRQALPELLAAARERGDVVPDAIRVELELDKGSWSAVLWAIESRLHLPAPPAGLRLSVSTLFDGLAGAIIEGVPVPVPAHS